MKIYRYIGKGQFLFGLPARDLRADELNDEQRELIEIAIKIGLYQVEDDERSRAKRRSDDHASTADDE